MNLPQSPCMNCPDRKVTETFNCHSHCEKYTGFKLWFEQEKKRKADEKKFYTHYHRRYLIYRRSQNNGK